MRNFTMSREQAIDVLNRQLEKGSKLLEKRSSSKIADLMQWQNRTVANLRRILGSDSHILLSFQDLAKEYGKHSWGKGNLPIDSSRRKSMARPLMKQLEHIRLAIDLLKKMQQEELDAIETLSMSEIQRKKVFVVHGHNEKVLSKTKEFLNKLQLEPVVLREQPNEGRTIIEKFERFSQVAFTVILLTPDDICGDKGIPHEKHKFRARQNVILELGFFLGKLGRQSICVLYSQGVEIPSDYHGVLYVEFDESDNWQTKLTKELKAAGIL